jgi:hypothetical protein
LICLRSGLPDRDAIFLWAENRTDDLDYTFATLGRPVLQRWRIVDDGPHLSLHEYIVSVVGAHHVDEVQGRLPKVFCRETAEAVCRRFRGAARLSNVQRVVVALHFVKPHIHQGNDGPPGPVEWPLGAISHEVGPEIAPCLVAGERETGRRQCVFDSHFAAVIRKIECTLIEAGSFDRLEDFGPLRSL